jgi:hypothetical protein
MKYLEPATKATRESPRAHGFGNRKSRVKKMKKTIAFVRESHNNFPAWPVSAPHDQVET